MTEQNKCLKGVTKRATYVTEWDDGETVLESPCIVNLLTHEITSIGKRKIIRSSYSNSNLDDNVEILDREYIRFSDGTEIDVIDTDAETTVKETLKENGYVMPFFRGKNTYPMCRKTPALAMGSVNRT
jgi:hypothetical protein